MGSQRVGHNWATFKNNNNNNVTAACAYISIWARVQKTLFKSPSNCHIYITMHKTDIMRTYCLAQGTQLSAQCWPKWQGHPKRGEYMYSYSWVGRNWCNIVKQLYSPNKKSPHTQHMKHGGCFRNCIILVFKRGGGNGIPLQYSRLENPLGGGAW